MTVHISILIYLIASKVLGLYTFLFLYIYQTFAQNSFHNKNAMIDLELNNKREFYVCVCVVVERKTLAQYHCLRNPQRIVFTVEESDIIYIALFHLRQ